MILKPEENDETSPVSTDSIGLKSRIKFSTIEVREFNRTLGDNPACTDGPPIALDWDFIDKKSMSIDEYEANRLPRKAHRHLLLSMHTRRNIMSRQYGYTVEELADVENTVRLVQKKREKTKNQSPLTEKRRLFAENARHIISTPFRTSIQ